MRRGNVDKTSKRKTGHGEDFANDDNGKGQSAASNLGFGASGGGPGGFKGLTSPISGTNDGFKRQSSNKTAPLTPIGMKGPAFKQRRQSVDAVLEQFRSGNRDVE